MKKIAFFDTKPYDKQSFDEALKKGINKTDYEIEYFESKLSYRTAVMAQGFDAVCAFVNDSVDKRVINTLFNLGVQVIAMRCAGYSNVDLAAAEGKIPIVRVPAYSPHAVAEHAAALLLCLNRKIHKAYNRTRDFNFNISELTGVDLYGKTAGVIGTGKIGKAFIEIVRGMGMKVIAYDVYPDKSSDIEYTDLETLFQSSDVISLHCPLTSENNRLLNEKAFAEMKQGVFIINTSRGMLIDSSALLDALNSGKVRGACLDVYEEESEYFYEDCSGDVVQDNRLALLISKPNVLLTSHQAFLTEEALKEIAATTIANLDEFFDGRRLTNEVKYTPAN